ncbi:MAG: SurA N-terminal domain-containing protein [Desulfatibacillaceae bacterium]|nr:SurA N-terminal domain-containing protein [Desulfatibacillaceae bacterium]
MRKHAGSWMLKAVLGLIALTFVFWGVGAGFKDDTGVVATVNGDRITRGQFDQVHRLLRENYRRQAQETGNEDLVASLNLPKMAVDQLIDSLLWTQKAQKLGMKVPEKELVSIIASDPMFSTWGRFSEARYEQVLRHYGYSRAEFEQATRDSLLAAKVQKLVAASISVSQDEALAWYRWMNRKVAVDYVAFDPARYQEFALDDEQVADYFAANEQDYLTEPTVRAQYLFFNPENFANQVVVSDQQIERHYQMEIDRFDVPETVEARHILLNVDEAADGQIEEETRQQALTLAQRARDGEDFARLATEHSHCPSASQGGYLGVFERDSMVKPFSDAAFSMEAGEISDPVRTLFGWHIIKVENVNEARIKTLDEVRETIRATLAKRQAQEMAYEAAIRAVDVSLGVWSMEETAKILGLEPISTGFFTAKGPLREIPSFELFSKTAFDLREQAFSRIVETPEGYYFMQVLERRPSTIPAFAEVKDKVRADLIAKKRLEVAGQDALAFAQALKQGASMEDLAAEKGLEIKSTGLFERNRPIPEIGFEPKVSLAAFGLSEQAPFTQEAVEGNDLFFVLRLAGQAFPEPVEFEQEKDMIVAQLLDIKRREQIESLGEQLRAQADIVMEARYSF